MIYYIKQVNHTLKTKVSALHGPHAMLCAKYTCTKKKLDK